MVIENVTAFDWYSLQHFMFGVLWFNLFGLKSFPHLILTHLLFEVYENSLSGVVLLTLVGWEEYQGDSFINSAFDNVCAFAGFCCTAFILRKYLLNECQTYVLYVAVMIGFWIVEIIDNKGVLVTFWHWFKSKM